MELGITSCQFASGSALSWVFIPGCLRMLPLFALQEGRGSPQWQGDHLGHRVASLLRGSGEAQESLGQKGRVAQTMRNFSWPRVALDRERHRLFMPCPAPPGRQGGSTGSPAESGEVRRWPLWPLVEESWISPNSGVGKSAGSVVNSSCL